MPTKNGWYEMKAAADENSAEIYIYEQIGKDWWDGSGVTAKGFIEDLQELGEVGSILLHINSPGGAVFDGVTIYNALKNHAAEITVVVDGMAASIASVIAMAGDTIEMAKGSMMFVHSPWSGICGGYNASELRNIAEDLDRVEASIRSIYADRTGLEDDEITQLLAAETYLGADEAVSKGFADTVGEGKKIAASLSKGDVQRAHLAQRYEFQIHAKDLELSQLRAEKKRLEAENEELREAPAGDPPADAAKVVSLCTEAGFTHLIAGFIDQRAPETQIVDQLEVMKGVRSKLVAAELPDIDKCMAAINELPNFIGLVLTEQAAALDPNIQTTQLPGPGPTAGSQPNRAEIYSIINKEK